MRPPPDFPASPYPFLAGGGLAPPARNNAVVSTAMRYRGVPYTWGGAKPKTGFDCSGLVKYVLGQLGVSLPHYAAGQWYSPNTVWVPPYRLQAGDLVFFVGSDGTRREPGHVGIYVGDGYLIDAPHTGASVRIDSLDERWFANNYVGAKRILGVAAADRRLAHVRKPGTPPTARTLIRLPTTPKPLDEVLRVAAPSNPTARAGSRGYWIWAGLLLGAVLLLAVAGALVIRRSRMRTTEPSPDASA
jgi:NlpC/P60 family protein